MKRTLPYLLCAAVGILAGWFMRPALIPTTGQDDASTRTRTATKHQRADRKTAHASTGGTKHTLHHLKISARKARSTGISPQISRQIERMDATALRSMVEQIVRDISRGHLVHTAENQRLMDAVLGELYRREGTGMMEWIEAVPEKANRINLTSAAIRILMKESPDSAAPWLEKNKDIYGPDPLKTGIFSLPAITGATERGAEDLLKAIRQNGTKYLSTDFPEDFDFAKFFAGLREEGAYPEGHGRSLHDPAATTWMARDPDAAWAALKGEVTTGERILGPLAAGMMAGKGEAAGMTWAAEKISALPPEHRELAVSTLFIGTTSFGNEAVSTAMTALPESEKRTFLRRLVGSGLADNAAVISGLDALPRDEALSIIAEAVTKSSLFTLHDSHQPSLDARRLLDEARTRYHYTEEESARIDTILKAKAPGQGG